MIEGVLQIICDEIKCNCPNLIPIIKTSPYSKSISIDSVYLLEKENGSEPHLHIPFKVKDIIYLKIIAKWLSALEGVKKVEYLLPTMPHT